MPFPKTVVLNCAGRGTRLGFGHPKCLVDIYGEPLIARQLACLTDVDDVRVVVGFDARRVIETVLQYRKNVTFVFNRRFDTTNTLASLCLGSINANPLVVSLDGDLLVHPDDLKKFLRLDGDVLGMTRTSSDEPVFIKTSNEAGQQHVIAFSRNEKSEFEWSGLLQIAADKLEYNDGFVFQLLEKYLPMRAVEIQSREIDTIGDYQMALNWAFPIYGKGEIHC